MNKKSIFLLTFITILLVSNIVEAADCYCNSCSDCISKINNPSCDVIYLTQDISTTGDCISINNNNKILDCQNYRITGPSQGGFSRGILIAAGYRLDNIEIRNCDVYNFEWNIMWYGEGADHVWVHDSHLHTCGWACIRLSDANDCIIENNLIENGASTGLRIVGDSQRNIVRNNIIRNCPNSACVYSHHTTTNNYVYNNILTSCRDAVYFHDAGWGVLASNWRIYNNYMAPTQYYFNTIDYSYPSPNFWNTNLQAGANIDGGQWICGNYLSNPTGTGYSDTCTDSDTNGICDSPYTLIRQGMADPNNVDNCPLAKDRSAPTTAITPNGAAWTRQDVGFTLSCYDPISGCDRTYYKIIDDGQSCGITGFTQGTSGTVTCASGNACQRRVCFYSVDNKGNSETVRQSNVFRIDKKIPTVSVTGAPANWQNTDATASISCSDTDSGCSPATYRLITYSTNPGSCPTTYASYTLSSPRTISNRVWVCGVANDSVGNTGFSTPVEFRVDKVSPTVSVIGAPANWQNTDATAGVSCADTGGSNCDATTYRLITYATNPGVCPATYASYTLVPPQTISSHVWVCGAARDNAGNTGVSGSFEFTVDKTAPTADITGESATWVTWDEVNLVCTDTGGSGCKTTKWYYFDADGTCSASKSSYTFSTSADTLNITGNHNDWLCLWVEDNAGNYDTEVSSRLMVDDGTPTTPVVTDDGVYTSSLTTLHAAWISSSASGIAEYQYAIGIAQYPNAGWDSIAGWTSAGTNIEVTRSDLSLTDGQTYYFNVRARSNSGLWSNVGYSDGITVNVCYQQACGTSCPGGVCDGNDNCYIGGQCNLTCSVPSPGSGNQRIWANSNCGRTDSYKCGNQNVCSNSYLSCTTGGSSTQVTGTWTSYTPPSGTYQAGDTIAITLNGISNTPSGFTILTECSMVKPGGSTIFFNNWGSGNTQFSYAIQPTDPLGTWTVDYCGLWSDFETNRGWNLRMDNTDYTFTVVQTQLAVSVTGAPANWQNTDATADVSCTSSAPGGCDPITYRLQTYDSEPGTCPSAYDSYTLSSPQTISSHKWVCGVGNDTMGNTGVSTPVEFRVDKVSPTVSVTGAPANWQNTDATASVSCSDTGDSDCDTATYRLVTYTTDPGSCPTTYASYTLSSPQIISSHVWACGTANDTADNMGVSTPVEFRVDTTPPSSQVNIIETYTTETTFNLSWSGTDDESGIDCYVIQYKYQPPNGPESGTSNITLPDGECTKQASTMFDAELITGNSDLDGYTFHFRSLAKDNADNWETKSGFDTYTKIFLAMVRFEVDQRFHLNLARKGIIKIIVRNSQLTEDTIHLSANLPEMAFDETGSQNIDIEMNPREFREVMAKIYPSSLGTFNLTVNANSLTNPQLTDSDWLEIIIGMPAEFPGLNDFGIILTVLLAALIYLKFVRNEN